MILTRHNQAVAGDPRRAVSLDRLEDYLDHRGKPLRVQAIAGAATAINSGLEAIKADLKSRFTFCDDNDIAAVDELVRNQVYFPVLSCLDPMARNVWISLEGDKEYSEDALVKAVAEYRSFWLWQTDAGLVWRACCELDWAMKGYDVMYEGRLEGSPLSKQRELTVLCDVREATTRSPEEKT